MRTIGITINTTSTDNLWENGINQNAIYLFLLLKKIGYNPYLITADKEQKNVLESLDFGLRCVSLLDSFKIPFSLIIHLGFRVRESMLKKWREKNKNVKLVSYQCGNHLIMDMESILFNSNKNRVDSYDIEEEDSLSKPNQIWIIPQMEKSCKDYYKFILNQKNATVVPFIWEPIFIENYIKDGTTILYDKREIKNIGIMEPNISVMKNLLPPLIIAENEFNCNRNIETLTMVGGYHIKDNKRLLQIIKKTNLFKNKKVFVEKRIKTPVILKKYIDLVLSWQWENNLNYLYLDVAWLGYPIVHNAKLCDDIGYYYNDFDLKGGQDVLNKAMLNHKDNSDEYLNKNRVLIQRYTTLNNNMLNQYRMLVEDVLNNRFKEYSYNKKDNSIF